MYYVRLVRSYKQLPPLHISHANMYKYFSLIVNVMDSKHDFVMFTSRAILTSK